jgi:hypothetical protein
MTFPEKIEIPREKNPKDIEYKLGGPSLDFKGSGIAYKDMPLSQFKRGSEFRLYGESILKKYNYDPNEYTLIFHIEPEWLNYFTLSKR